MKKLSFVLALILVLSCFAFAACGDKKEDNSSAASSSEAASGEAPSSEAPSSEAPSSEAPSTEDSSAEDTSDESSEAPKVEDPKQEPSAEPTNIAMGKTYDALGYKAGGDWPADYTANLTDGVAAAELTFDNQWFAFCTSAGDNGNNVVDGIGAVTIDLGEVSYVSKVRVNTIFGDNVEGSGINSASKIAAYVGDSAGNFTYVGDLTSATTEGVAWAELTCAAQGKYLKLEVTLNGTFAFINEIEVYN